MTEIYLIRHGQASFGTDDYDKLSPRGVHQCELLGRHLRAQGIDFTASYSGPLRRQRESAAACDREAMGASDGCTVWEAFREYDASEIFMAYRERVLAETPEFAAAIEGTAKDRRLFQRALMAVTAHWIGGTATDAPIERFVDFRARVDKAIEALLERHGSRERIAVHTSGGVIAAGVGLALGLDHEPTLALNWQVLNSAITRIRYGRSGYMLAAFNAIPHLEREYDPELITFR